MGEMRESDKKNPSFLKGGESNTPSYLLNDISASTRKSLNRTQHGDGGRWKDDRHLKQSYTKSKGEETPFSELNDGSRSLTKC